MSIVFIVIQFKYMKIKFHVLKYEKLNTYIDIERTFGKPEFPH